MRRLSRTGLCMLAVAAIGAVASASASAAAPEYGRCVAIAKTRLGSGLFTNSTCTREATGRQWRKYEWKPGPGPEPGFEWEEKSIYSPKFHQCKEAISDEEDAQAWRKKAETAPEPEKKFDIEQAEALERAYKQDYELAGVKKGSERAECEKIIEDETAKAPAEFQTVPIEVDAKKVPSTEVRCAHVAATGEFSGHKGLADVVITFGECTLRGTACQSPLANEGEIVTSALVGELGIVEVKKGKIKAGIALFAAHEGSPFAVFACGATTFEVTGSVIREVVANRMTKLETNGFGESKGMQNFESFLEGPKDVLSTSIDGSVPLQTGLRLKALQRSAEEIEVNTSV